MTRMFLYQAARCELTACLKQDAFDFAVLDRYAADYYAYGIPSFMKAVHAETEEERHRQARRLASVLLEIGGTIQPDIGVFLFVEIGLALKRWQQVSGGKPDVYERQGEKELQRVQNVYRDILLNPSDYPFTGKVKISVPMLTEETAETWTPAHVHNLIWAELTDRLEDQDE